MNDLENKEGWSVDVSIKSSTHYYRKGISLCKLKRVKFHFDKFIKDRNYTQIFGSVCSKCQKILLNENE